MQRKMIFGIVLACLLLLSATAIIQMNVTQVNAAPPGSTAEKTRFTATMEIADIVLGLPITPATFEVLSLNWGEINNIGSPKTLPKMLAVTKLIDQYSVDLFLACAEQTVWPSANLTVVQSNGDENLEILTWELSNVEVVGYDVQAENIVKDGPSELLTLYFNSINYTTTLYNPDGTIVGSDSEFWDFSSEPPVKDYPPVADPNGPYTGTVGSPVTFDGSGSSDIDGTIVTYEWYFEGPDFYHSDPEPFVYGTTYSSPGTFTVTLTVTDNDGLTDTTTTTVEIIEDTNTPPVADPNGPYENSIEEITLFYASGSTDLDGTIVAYDWDFGDGNTGWGVTPTHVYSSSGTHIVTLIVTDNDGATDSAITTAEITDS